MLLLHCEIFRNLVLILTLRSACELQVAPSWKSETNIITKKNHQLCNLLQGLSVIRDVFSRIYIGCLGGGHSHYGLTGRSSQFEGLTLWLPNGPGGILRSQASYKIPTQYTPPHANLVIPAKITNKFWSFLLVFFRFCSRNCEKKIFITRCYQNVQF